MQPPTAKGHPTGEKSKSVTRSSAHQRQRRDFENKIKLFSGKRVSFVVKEGPYLSIFPYLTSFSTF